MGPECAKALEETTQKCILDPPNCKVSLKSPKCIPYLKFPTIKHTVGDLTGQITAKDSTGADGITAEIGLSMHSGLKIGVHAFDIDFESKFKRKGGVQGKKPNEPLPYTTKEVTLMTKLVMAGKIPLLIRIATSVRFDLDYDVETTDSATMEATVKGTVHMPGTFFGNGARHFGSADTRWFPELKDFSAKIKLDGKGTVDAKVMMAAGPQLHVYINGVPVALFGPLQVLVTAMSREEVDEPIDRHGG